MTTSEIIKSLQRIAAHDVAIVRAIAERQRVEKELVALRKSLDQARADALRRRAGFDDLEKKVQQQEKVCRDERSKLADRRAALTTFSNYKLQQAAEREIENSEREIDQREEAVLTLMEKVEQQRKEIDAAIKLIGDLESRLATEEEERREEVARLVEREARHRMEREDIAAGVDQAVMKQYDRIREKFPLDPLAPVAGSACGVCQMQLAPQVVVTILKGGTISRCAGCGRIMYLPESASASHS